MFDRSLFTRPGLWLAVILLLIAALPTHAGLHPVWSPQAVIDTVPFYDTSVYNQDLPKPNAFLEHPVGQWPNHYEQIVRYIQLLAAESDRVEIEKNGMTHEGRITYNVFISTPENLAARKEHRDTMARLADPTRNLPAADLDRMTADMPAFAWLGYSIHGDEISGTDASVQLIYHLAAATDQPTMELLNNLIIIIDPSENPDGRERYLSMLQTYKSSTPNYDAQSLQHSGVWPRGRGNHYWFDLNRDWILLTQPETGPRVATIVHYNPVLVVDAHEMGSDDNFLMSPPREPINHNTPPAVLEWYETYKEDQAAAFDQRAWPYYRGEWNEQWYVGYGSAWPTLFGSIGILYEQAGVDGQFVRQSDDYVLTYHQAINQQFTSSLANLGTTARHKADLLKQYRKSRADIVAAGQKSGLTFLFVPGEDKVRMNRFVSSLTKQGIRVDVATEGFSVNAADPYGETFNAKRFPAGTYLVSTAQAHGALAKAILEFDPRLSNDFLEEERRELEKNDESRMYEISAWSPALAYNIEAYRTTSAIAAPFRSVTEIEPPTGDLQYPDAGYALIVPMEGELTYRMLERLFREEFVVYASQKEFALEGRTYPAGSLVLRKRGNPDTMPQRVRELARELGVNVYGVSSGLSSEGSLLGAPTFQLLRQPRVALAAGSPLSSTSTGSLWFTLDKEIELPHSLINLQSLNWVDLSAYNVLILPSSWGGGLDRELGKHGASMISDWVSDGGTLICVGSAAAWAADSATGLSRVRLRDQAYDKLGQYREALERELGAESATIDTMALFHPEKMAAKEDEEESAKSPSVTDAFKEREAFAQRFAPAGTILRGDIDTEHWLTAGLDERVPIMVYSRNVFLSADPISTPVRFSADPNKLRLSGLLWPEARERWAGSAYLTRERKGKGQVILFATDPNMRAYWYGTRQLFLDAVMYGPGYTRSSSPYEQ